jgi:hypothetical protein
MFFFYYPKWNTNLVLKNCADSRNDASSEHISLLPSTTTNRFVFSSISLIFINVVVGRFRPALARSQKGLFSFVASSTSHRNMFDFRGLRSSSRQGYNMANRPEYRHREFAGTATPFDSTAQWASGRSPNGFVTNPTFNFKIARWFNF